PVAFASGDPVDDEGALGAVAAELGPVARPERLIRLAALPLLPSGKPDRRAFAALAVHPG
ncbi:MAG: hypothetical protein QM598_00940, partial [Protaetiibacter sp.]